MAQSSRTRAAAFAPSLITPIEPGERLRHATAREAAASAQHSVHTTAFRTLEVAVASICGTAHPDNEDAHSPLDAAVPLFVVADGVGGGAMAQTASRELVAHLHASLAAGPPQADAVRRAMLAADRAIASLIAQVTPAPGAATVALCAPLNLRASKWLIAWVGDCRIYRFAPEGARVIELLSRDDSFRQLGEPLPAGAALDDPARMVGNGATHGANVELHTLAAGELLLLCSDGVHKHLDDAAWCRVLARPLPLVQRCAALVTLARERGSSDDATVLAVQRDGASLPRASWGLRRGPSDHLPRTLP